MIVDICVHLIGKLWFKVNKLMYLLLGGSGGGGFAINNKKIILQKIQINVMNSYG